MKVLPLIKIHFLNVFIITISLLLLNISVFGKASPPGQSHTPMLTDLLPEDLTQRK